MLEEAAKMLQTCEYALAKINETMHFGVGFENEGDGMKTFSYHLYDTSADGWVLVERLHASEVLAISFPLHGEIGSQSQIQ